jgi:hypothetical protein
MRAADILSILFTVCAIFFIFCLGALEYGCSQDSNLKGYELIFFGDTYFYGCPQGRYD